MQQSVWGGFSCNSAHPQSLFRPLLREKSNMLECKAMKKTQSGAGAKVKLVGVGIRLPEDLWREVRMRAVERNIPAQDIVAAALTTYLRRSNQQSERRKE